MSLYYLKPIVWNTLGYQQPSGVNFTSGYPKEHGFGHEEWNNSPRLTIEEDGEQFRVFYTQGLRGQPLDEHPEDIFVFMIAYHDRQQFLVGVAGGATSLFDNDEERERLVGELERGGADWREAWEIQNVRNCYDNDINTFRRNWDWMPTWKCPANLFLWLEEPLLLNPREITGNDTKLVMMFAACQKITQQIALDILTNINQDNDADILENLKARCNDELDKQTDITQIQKNEKLSPTTKKALINARLGQGKFRADLMQIWNNSCAVTECTVLKVLKASHIKPWRDSTNNQRLDPNNGLLITANLDALFDSGLISFDDSGEMIVSQMLSTEEREMLGIPQPLCATPNPIQCRYLAHHRKTHKLGI